MYMERTAGELVHMDINLQSIYQTALVYVCKKNIYNALPGNYTA